MLPTACFSRWTLCICTCAMLLAGGYVNSAPLDRDAVRRGLQDFSAAGMDRRLGPDYTFYHSNTPPEVFPNVWLIPTKQDPGGRPYQLGGPWVSDPGLYSSTQGQITYSPDAGALGIDRFNVLEWMHGAFSERPEPPWWGGFRPEPFAPKWTNAAGGNPGVPIAIARAQGGWSNCGLILFSSGLVEHAGTSTATGTNASWRFPSNKVLTAIALTSKSEFALITLTDVNTKRGQVAVLALQNGGATWFAHDWQDKFPCLPGTAWISGMKLLGYIDLPGMEFPTGITAAGNDVNRWVFGPDGNVGMLNMWNPTQQATRDSFRTGKNAGYVSTAGWAAVISKHESKVAFIDLQPLFTRVNELTLTTQANFDKTRNLGSGPAQWPYTFDADPAWKPSIIKMVDVPSPTAVVASLSRGDKARAYVASLDGTVRGYRLGGLATTSPADPRDIQVANQVTVGRNPTCLAVQKYSTDKIIAVSRGDREIAWLRDDFNSSLTVLKRMRDARLVDPVFCEMSDTHGIEASVITVADFRGRRVLNYRFGRVVFELQGGAIFGMGPTGADDFECGGWLDTPGSPFCISATNLN